MKRSRISNNDTFIKIKFDDVSDIYIRHLISNKQMIEFYNITEKSFTNDSLSQFLKDYKRTLINKYKDNNFKFINCSKNKTELEHTFKKIQVYFDENNLHINVWNSFIELKITPYIDETKYTDIFNYILPLNIIELYNLLKIIYSRNNLVIFANTLCNKKKKIKDKSNAIELINNNNAWNMYIDYYMNDNESFKKDKIYKLNNIYNKQLMKQLFVYYKKDVRKQYLQTYMSRWIKHYRQLKRDYIYKIDVGINPEDGLTSYLRLLHLDTN